MVSRSWRVSDQFFNAVRPTDRAKLGSPDYTKQMLGFGIVRPTRPGWCHVFRMVRSMKPGWCQVPATVGSTRRGYCRTLRLIRSNGCLVDSVGRCAIWWAKEMKCIMIKSWPGMIEDVKSFSIGFIHPWAKYIQRTIMVMVYQKEKTKLRWLAQDIPLMTDAFFWFG